MAFTGYRAYRGVGGLGSVDFSTVVGTAAADASSISLVGLGHAAQTTYTYVVRPVVDDLETPDFACVAEFVTDADGDWPGNRPAPVLALAAAPVAGGKVRLQWRYTTPRGGVAPADFAVFVGPSPQVDTSGSPAATVTYGADGLVWTELTLTSGTTYWLVVTARTAGGVASQAALTGPVVADAAGAASPVIYADAAF